MIKDRANMSMYQLYEPAMVIEDQVEADEYFEQLVRHNLSFGGRTREEAEAIERDNLGYYAGYHSNETRERVERLFKCAHPVFGEIAKNGPPTFSEALMAGMQRGLKLKGRNS